MCWACETGDLCPEEVGWVDKNGWQETEEEDALYCVALWSCHLGCTSREQHDVFMENLEKEFIEESEQLALWDPEEWEDLLDRGCEE